jgi:hypothetical protein
MRRGEREMMIFLRKRRSRMRELEGLMLASVRKARRSMTLLRMAMRLARIAGQISSWMSLGGM